MTEHIREPYRVEWEDIGEGYWGDYNESDPEDKPLLRFYFSERNADGEWEDLDSASYCTLVPTDTPGAEQKAMLALLMDKAWDALRSGSYKRRLEELSWIDSTWLGKGV